MRRGFTILEIMLTLLFLGTVLISILNVFNLNIKNTHYLLHKREAIDLASSQLEAINYSSRLLTLNHNFYQIQIEEEEPLLGVNRIVTVNISWNEAARTESISLAKTFYSGVD